MHELSSELRDQLEREKLAALYQFAYGLSHEINNPLTNISARAQSLLATEKDTARRRSLATIHLQAMRAYEMIADLMLFARPPALAKQEVDLNDLISEVVSQWQTQATAQVTQLDWQPMETGPTVVVDRNQLAVALGALLRNSLEALGQGGRIEIHLTAKTKGNVEIGVSDTGPGIPPEVRRHLFDPYFSGREAGRGLGLGLSKCWRIVELHGGQISVDSPEAGGARFIISLPIRG